MTYTYETRCRKCGLIAVRTTEMENNEDFKSWMRYDIDHPQQIECSACKKPTVHEIISFTEIKNAE